MLLLPAAPWGPLLQCSTELREKEKQQKAKQGSVSQVQLRQQQQLQQQHQNRSQQQQLPRRLYGTKSMQHGQRRQSGGVWHTQKQVNSGCCCYCHCWHCLVVLSVSSLLSDPRTWMINIICNGC